MREMDTRFPTTDTVFEYCVDPNQRGWLSWENKLSSNYRYADPSTLFILFQPLDKSNTLSVEVMTAAAVPRSSPEFASTTLYGHGCVF